MTALLIVPAVSMVLAGAVGPGVDALLRFVQDQEWKSAPATGKGQSDA